MGTDNSISRRSFIGAASAAAAAATMAALAGCAPTSKEESLASTDPTSWDEEADLVIIGCGRCGSSAAISAAENGASVIVLEAATTMGGSAVLCAGSFVAAGTKMQADAGITDDPDLYLSDVKGFLGDATIERAGDDWKLFEMQAREGAATVDWLQAMGVEFNGPLPYPLHSADRLHVLTPTAGEWPKALQPRMEELGVQVHFRTPAERLITDENGRVAGVAASGRKYRANKGVLIAAGGMDSNVEMKKKYYSSAIAGIAAANGFNDGSGYKMAQMVGADITDLTDATSNLMRTSGPGPDAGITQKQKWMPYGLSNAGAILVNSAGERFCDEELSDKDLIPLCEAQPDRQCWMVYDEAVARNFRDFPNMIVSSLSGVGWGTVEDFIERGGIVTGDTIEDVAAQAGIDATGLTSQIDKWNKACKDAIDEDFGRKTFGREEAGTLGAGLSTPPFYIYGPIHAECNQSWASLAITENFEVKNVEGDVIPGLYSGGQMGHGLSPIAGGGHGGTMCWAFTSGRLAGKHIASL